MNRQTSAEIAAALGDHGFDVECAYNGRDGLLKATADKYDAVVLDRMMPGDLDGWAFSRRCARSASKRPC